jgi:CheY-like chemotaxis protein
MSTVLVVDDEPIVRSMISCPLEQLGYRVHPASHGREALSILRQEPIRMVLSDWNMPEMDGLALLEPLVDGLQFLGPLVHHLVKILRPLLLGEALQSFGKDRQRTGAGLVHGLMRDDELPIVPHWPAKCAALREFF